MLEAIRNNAQSWGVKLLFAIIVLVFVFWGVGSFRDSKRQVVATVGDQEIGMREFVQTYQRQVETLRRQRGEVTSRDLQEMDLKRQVLDQMINERLIRAKAQELGLFVGSGQVRTRIREMGVFHGDNATFDPRRYQTMLRMNNLNPAQFESDIRMDLVSSSLRQAVVSPVQVREAEARDMFDYVQAKARIDYVQFPVQDYMDQVTVDAKDVQAYYQEHKKDYQVPAAMRMQVLRITPESLADNQEINAEEIADYYQDHQKQFSRPEQVKARHILVQVGEDAAQDEVEQARQKIAEAAERLEQGAEFAQVAGEVSEGPSAAEGGDLGWFGRGSMVQAFEDAAFALQPGEISEPVRTRFGFHLIRVEDRREAGVQPLDQVREEIEQRLAEDKAMGQLEDKLDEVLQIVLTSQDMHQAAEAVGLEVEDMGPFGSQNPPSGLGLNQEQVQRLMEMNAGEITESPIMLEDGYLMVKKTEHEPAHVPELKEIQDRVRTAFARDKAKELAHSAAQDALHRLGQEATVQELGLQTTSSRQFTRRGAIPGLGKNQDLARDAFAADPGKWLQQPYFLAQAWVVARLAEITPPEDAAWEEQKDFWVENVRRMKRQTLFQAYLQGLREDAEISILAPEALEYS
jgi:peptidyl-prolyl cis-trans isomerase D